MWGSNRFTQIVKYTSEKAFTFEGGGGGGGERRKGFPILLSLLSSKTKKCWPIKNCG